MKGHHGHGASLSCKRTTEGLSEARGHSRSEFPGKRVGWPEECALVGPAKGSGKGIPGEQRPGDPGDQMIPWLWGSVRGPVGPQREAFWGIEEKKG